MNAENPFGRSADEVVAEALMELVVSAAVLIVEGNTDARALEEHLASSVAIVIAVGKNNAIAAAQIVDTQACGPRIAVLVDRDHDGDRGVGSRVLVTAARDLDTELLCSGDVLRRLFKMLALPLDDKAVAGHRKQIVGLAGAASALLHAAVTAELSVRVTKISLNSVLALETIQQRVEALAAQAISKSRGPNVSADELTRRALQELPAFENRLESCQGHFVHQATAAIAVRWRANQIQQAVWGIVRTEEFVSTGSGQALEAWGREISVPVMRTHGPPIAA